MSFPVLQDAELDALTQVCNAGMEHAAAALSQMMGKGVSIEVPRLQMVHTAEAGDLLKAQQVIGLHLQILGHVRGSILILLHEQHARGMLELLIGRPSPAHEPLSELEVSALKEVGNILGSACLNAFGGMLKMPLLPSVPVLFSGEAGEVLAHALEPPPNGEAIVMIDTMFSLAGASSGGSIVLIPAQASLDAMLTALGAR